METTGMARRRELRQRCKQLVAGFDARWTGRLLTLCAVLTAANFFAGIHPALEWTGLVAAGIFSAGLCGYFAWLLFGRLQCGLLEWCVLIAFLGNMEGLLLTTVSLGSLGTLAWALVPLTAAWGLYGAVTGLAQAKILETQSALARVGLLAANWLSIAAPALLICGLLLKLPGMTGDERFTKVLISRSMAAWSWPMLGLGAIGIVLAIGLDRRVGREAREIVEGK